MLNRVLITAAAALVSASAAYADGHVTAGEKLVAKHCKACHTISDGDDVILKGGKIGPNLFGIIGRTAGTYEGFKYGKHTAEAGEKGLAWDEDEIVDYLANPRNYLRTYLGNKKAKSKMSFKMKDEKKRMAVAAYRVSLN